MRAVRDVGGRVVVVHSESCASGDTSSGTYSVSGSSSVDKGRSGGCYSTVADSGGSVVVNDISSCNVDSGSSASGDAGSDVADGGASGVAGSDVAMDRKPCMSVLYTISNVPLIINIHRKLMMELKSLIIENVHNK